MRRQNVVDPGRLSPSYESRLAKYAKRGFRVAVPGFPGRSGINSSLYLVPYAETKVRGAAAADGPACSQPSRFLP